MTYSKFGHAKVLSATTIGINGQLIIVEADLSPGMVNFHIVGLPDKAIKESKERVRAAFKNCGIKIPDRLITINLAPADIKKQDALFDIPIAIAILQAASIITMQKEFLEESLFLGELALSGEVRPIKGVLAIVYSAKQIGIKRIFLPAQNQAEAAVISGVEIYGINHLSQLVGLLTQNLELKPTQETLIPSLNVDCSKNFSQVKGQVMSKQALIAAAVGEHNILFIGPPGAGKTMLAERLSTIMPAMSFDQAIEVTKIYSIAGKLESCGFISQRPFRSPHHTISQVGLSGGSASLTPGEISLAHNGILFLDEFTEFGKHVIEVLRQPLENKKISISRVSGSVTYPTDFLLVVALNPCPCGYYKQANNSCICSEQVIKKYQSRISGPILDRIDIHVNIPALNYQELTQNDSIPLSSQEMRKMVEAGINMRHKRNQPFPNAKIPADQIKTYCHLDEQAQSILAQYFDKFSVSARSYHKILKLARTLADIEQSDLITANIIKKTISLRFFDKK